MDHDSFVFRTSLPDHEEAIQDMKPLEAVDYLLGCIQNLNAAFKQVETEVDDKLGTMPMVSRRIWLCLLLARGGIKSLDDLTSFVYFDRALDQMPDNSSMVKSVKRARKYTKPEFGRIVTVAGLGYRFERASKGESGDDG